jgi:hypothetical protein
MNSTLGWVKVAECAIGELGEGDGVDEEEVETDADSRSEPWLAEPGRGNTGTTAKHNVISPNAIFECHKKCFEHRQRHHHIWEVLHSENCELHSASIKLAMRLWSFAPSKASSDGMVKNPPLTGVWKAQLDGGLLMVLGQADNDGVGGVGE